MRDGLDAVIVTSRDAGRDFSLLDTVVLIGVRSSDVAQLTSLRSLSRS